MISSRFITLKKASIRSISYPFTFNRHYTTTIPFDTKPFPFNRFEPCCPDEAAEKAENGFIPCQKHPIPKVLGRKIDMETDMKGSGIPKDRHMVICVGEQGKEWTRSKVEAVTDGSVYAINQLHHQYLHYQKTHHLPIPPPTDREMLTTICDRPPTSSSPSSSSSSSTCDIMIFPEFRLYSQIDYQQLNLTTAKSSSSTDFVKVLETLWNDPSSSQLPQVTEQMEMKDIDAVILVCTHERRDMRCGVLGPLLVNAFRNCLNDDALKNKNVLVYGTSHFGGHKYAGNVIIHQKGLGGHMYGNVRECHVPAIIDRHIIHGKVIKELWRSQVTPPSL